MPRATECVLCCVWHWFVRWWLCVSDGSVLVCGFCIWEHKKCGWVCRFYCPTWRSHFSPCRRPTELILFQCMEICLKLFRNYFRSLLQLMNISKHVQYCWNNFKIISLSWSNFISVSDVVTCEIKHWNNFCAEKNVQQKLYCDILCVPVTVCSNDRKYSAINRMIFSLFSIFY